MSITPIKVRIVKRPIIKARFVPQLPANLTGRTAIAVERNGSIYYLDLDYSKLAESLSFDPAQNVVAILRSDGVWYKTTVATLSTMIGADKPNLVAIANSATAADKLGYWSGAAQYSLTDFTAYMRTLLDDPDATTARATLGLVIGTDVQPHDAELDALAGLVSAADRLPYFTGPGAAALAVLTPFARTLLDDADAATMRATIDAQQRDSDLDAIAALTPTDDDFIQRKAGAWVNRSVAQVKADLAINNVDNTSDADKPISTATQAALDLKADKAITVSAGTGLAGGGDLSANRSVALNAASITSLGKADTAVQPARAVNTGTGLTGGGDLSADRTIALDAASQASLAKADTAVQPGALAPVATTGAYSDLSGKPTLGTAAATDATDYATAAQGAKADTAVQPVDLGALAAKSKIDVPGDINATGTPSSSTYLRGDGTWAAGGGGGGGDLLAANNLSDLANADTSLDNLGGTAVGKAVFTAVDQAAAQTAIGAKVLAGHLYGMEMTWLSGAAIGFSAGECADSSAAHYIKAASAIAEKYIHVAWAAGTAQGMLDTGSVANGTYHIFAIGKSTDAAAFDYLASTSPTTPLMPATWDLKRRIGSIIRKGAALLRFTQDGDSFFHYNPVDDAQAVAYTTSDLPVALTVPTGIRVRPLINIHNTNVGGNNASWVNGDGMLTQSTNIGSIVGGGPSTLGSIMKFFFTHLRTDLSGRLVRRASNVSNFPTYSIGTFGWIDTRGRLAE